MKPDWTLHGRAAAVWLAVALGVAWLWHDSGSRRDAVAIAEAQSHKVASVDGGRVESVAVQPGQTVRRGDVLVQLAAGDLDAQAQRLRAELSQASSAVEAAALTLGESGFDAERALTQELQSALAAAADGRAGAARDAAELAAVAAELRRERELVARGLVRNDRALELDLREQGLREAVRNAPARAAALQARVGAAQRGLAQWRERFARGDGAEPMQARLQPLRDAVREKRAALDAVLAQRQARTIAAPSDGLVMQVLARPGEVVRGGEPVLLLAEPAATRLVAYVVERRRLQIRPGQPVTLRRRPTAPDGSVPMELAGEVVAVAGAVTALPERVWTSPQQPLWGKEVYIRLPPGAAVAPGEQVDVQFGAPPLALPVRSVAQRDGAAAAAPVLR